MNMKFAVLDYSVEPKTISKFKTAVKHVAIQHFDWLVNWLTFLQRNLFHGENWSSMDAFANGSTEFRKYSLFSGID